MVQTKKMNEGLFSKLHKELTIAGELIRARQEEEQGLLDEFNKESKRFFFGKISERALASSVKKTNIELKRLDHAIRENIARVRSVGVRATDLASAQAPIGYRVTLSGIIGGKVKKRKVKRVKAKEKVKKKTVKKKVSKKKKR